VGGALRRSTARISSRPSRGEAAAPRWGGAAPARRSGSHLGVGGQRGVGVGGCPESPGTSAAARDHQAALLV
jgi:hypothetical protein